MRLPHKTLEVLSLNAPAPPSSVAVSSSFAYSSSGLDDGIARQHVARRIIDRFASVTQLMTSIIHIKTQAQAKQIYAPDPARPLPSAEEPLIANWLLDMAGALSASNSTPGTSAASLSSRASSNSSRSAESQNGFLIAAHAVLALHELLPFAPSNGDEFGAPVPLPTVQSTEAALRALHLLARSITTNVTHGRTRTQALLLDAMPRTLSLLDLFASTAFQSPSHFSLVAEQRDMIHELLAGLTEACTALEKTSPGGSMESGVRAALERSRLSLGNVADICQAAVVKSGRVSPGLATLIHGDGGPQPASDQWEFFNGDLGQTTPHTLDFTIGYGDSTTDAAAALQYMNDQSSFPFDFPAAS